MPDKLRDMQELFLVEATKYNVFPLDNNFLQRAADAAAKRDRRPDRLHLLGWIVRPARRQRPQHAQQVLLHHGRGGNPAGSRRGDAQHARWACGGYGLYLLKGKPVFAYNFLAVEQFRWEGPAALTPGKHTIMFDFKYDGPGFGKGGTGVLSVDGKEVASKAIPHTIPFIATVDETFDVGMDTRTGVDDNDYQPPFRFTGTIDKLTVTLVPLSAEEEQLLKQKAHEAVAATQ